MTIHILVNNMLAVRTKYQRITSMQFVKKSLDKSLEYYVYNHSELEVGNT